MKTKKKVFALAVCALMLIAGTIMVTVAYLQDTTDAVVNTFTAGNVDITLTETKNPDGTTTENANNIAVWSAQMIPGAEYAKNPLITVNRENTNIDIYLFVKFEEIGNASTYLTYDSTLDDADCGWTQGTGTVEGGNGVPTDVWFREVAKDEKGPNDAINPSWQLLAGSDSNPDGSVTVKTTVTEQNMTAAAAAKLQYTAYAIQKSGFETAADAWNEIYSPTDGRTTN